MFFCGTNCNLKHSCEICVSNCSLRILRCNTQVCYNIPHGIQPFFISKMYVQVDKKFAVFYGIRRFTTVFTTAGHQPLSFNPHPKTCFLKIRFNIIPHPRLHLPCGSFLSGFITIFFVYIYDIPAHPLLPDVIILIKFGIGCNVWSSSYRSLH
jgi:hypothetical protein